MAVKDIPQLFFGKDEGGLAIAAAKEYNEALFEIVDVRSNRPRPRMYVLTHAALMQMVRARMLKRMWGQHQICWPTPTTVEDEGYIGRGPEK